LVDRALEFIDLVFPVMGYRLPSCHGYELFSSLSGITPELHNDSRVSFLTISGMPDKTGFIYLDRHSRLRLRMPYTDIPKYSRLAGKTLSVAGHKIVLGIPEIEILVPAERLKSRIVVLAGALEPEVFTRVAQERLQSLGINGTVRVPYTNGQPHRKVMFLKGRRFVGFSAVVENLSAADSLYLQARGMGKRRHMGCGFFLPYVSESFS